MSINDLFKKYTDYEELIARGYVLNPNCWIGDGFIFCKKCKVNTYSFVISRDNHNVIVCKECSGLK